MGLQERLKTLQSGCAQEKEQLLRDQALSMQTQEQLKSLEKVVVNHLSAVSDRVFIDSVGSFKFFQVRARVHENEKAQRQTLRSLRGQVNSVHVAVESAFEIQKQKVFLKFIYHEIIY